MTDTSGPIVTTGRVASRSSPLSTGMIRVVSWNIQFGVEVDAAAAELASNDRLADADILLLQEMDETGTARLAESLSMNHVYAAPGLHQQTGRNFGNAVLTPWPLAEPTVVALPFKSSVKGQDRVLVRAQVVVGEQAIAVGSVHTEVPSLGSAKRLAQFAEIARSFAGAAEQPAIVGGDFNTITKRGITALSDRLAAVGATRVTAGAGSTLRRQGREFTLDHVFARHLDPVATGVVPGLAASDHRPIWVLLRNADVRNIQTPAV